MFPNDHRPAHVHVVGAACEAVFILRCPDGPPELRENYGFRQSDLGGIGDALAQALAELCAQWTKIHADFRSRV